MSELRELLIDTLRFLERYKPPAADDPCRECGHPRRVHAALACRQHITAESSCKCQVFMKQVTGIRAHEETAGGRTEVVGIEIERYRLAKRIRKAIGETEA
jgi:hypothetical protein